MVGRNDVGSAERIRVMHIGDSVVGRRRLFGDLLSGSRLSSRPVDEDLVSGRQPVKSRRVGNVLRLAPSEAKVASSLLVVRHFRALEEDLPTRPALIERGPDVVERSLRDRPALKHFGDRQPGQELVPPERLASLEQALPNRDVVELTTIPNAKCEGRAADPGIYGRLIDCQLSLDCCSQSSKCARASEHVLRPAGKSSRERHLPILC